MNGYWANGSQTRISRRRTLAAVGAGALGAAFLAACGGSDKQEQASTGDKSGLLTTPSDTTAQAKAGGTLKHFQTLDAVQGLDPLSSNHGITSISSAYVYSRLLKFTVEKYPKLASQTVEGDVAQSYELSPDKLTLTMKLRQGIKWDSRSPTSGRTLDAQDVLFSWNKFSKSHPAASDLAYDAQRAPGAAIESASTPDSSTVVFKLKSPDVSLLPLLASYDRLYVMPRESDGGFDTKSVMRGSGPWMLDEYVPSARFSWKRNPDYYVKDRPFPDQIDQPIVTEYAARLAQFRAGNIYTSVVTANDVVQTKRDLPDTRMMQALGFPATSSSIHVTFGYDGDSPWKDVRLRQALSMTVDREPMIGALYNSDNFVSQGFDVASARNTILLPGWQGYWLDPANEKDFGPNAKYLNYNLDEAKKLISAAGGSGGVEVKLYFTPSNPPPVPQAAEVWAGMFRDGGFKVTQVPLSAQEWFTNYYAAYLVNPTTGRVKGYNGVNQLFQRQFPSAAASLYGMLHPASGNYMGVTPDGSNPEKGDTRLNALLEKMRVEFDLPAQQTAAKDIQRMVAGQAYHIPNSGVVKTFSLIWPALGNAGVNNIFGATDPAATAGPGSVWQEGALQWWVDSTKAPLGKS